MERKRKEEIKEAREVVAVQIKSKVKADP